MWKTLCKWGLRCSNIDECLLRTRQQRFAVDLVGMLLLLFTVRVTLIRVITGGPLQHPVLIPDVTNGNTSSNLNRKQYFNLSFFAKQTGFFWKSNLDSEANSSPWVYLSSGRSSYCQLHLAQLLWQKMFMVAVSYSTCLLRKLKLVENLFSLVSAGDSDWICPFLTSLLRLYSTILLQLLPWSKRMEYYYYRLCKIHLPSFQVN